MLEVGCYHVRLREAADARFVVITEMLHRRLNEPIVRLGAASEVKMMLSVSATLSVCATLSHGSSTIFLAARPWA